MAVADAEEAQKTMDVAVGNNSLEDSLLDDGTIDNEGSRERSGGGL